MAQIEETASSEVEQPLKKKKRRKKKLAGQWAVQHVRLPYRQGEKMADRAKRYGHTMARMIRLDVEAANSLEDRRRNAPPIIEEKEPKPAPVLDPRKPMAKRRGLTPLPTVDRDDLVPFDGGA